MDGDELMRIGELSRRSGVSVPLLRMWEQRYGIPAPRRTAGGQRLYSDADRRVVDEMRRRIAEGLPASAAARLVASEHVAPLHEDAAGELRADLTRALDAFDEPSANAVLDRILGRFSVRTALSEIVVPYLQELGARWEAGRASIAQEHFATMVLRGRLLGLARNWGSGSGPRALLAGPPGEHHDLGLICFGLGLREAGWRITLLGPNSPGSTIAEAASVTDPDVVVVAAMEEHLLVGIADELSAVGARHRLVLAGPGATSALATRLGAERMTDEPVAAAQRLADLTGAPRNGPLRGDARR